MHKALALGLLSLSHQLYVTEAAACGATPYLLDPLLPLPDATDVPLDAALISSSNETTAVITLRKATEPDGDAGAADVALTTECHFAFQGALCVARPDELLEPRTAYEWSVAMVEPPGIEPGYLEPSDWQRFTTSEDTHQPLVPEIDVAVTSHQTIENPPCGIDRTAKLSFSSQGLQSPVVLNVAGLTPSYVMQAVVLTAEEPTELMLYSPPNCIVPEAFDRTGARTALPELCLDDELPATPVDDNGQPIEEPAEEAPEEPPELEGDDAARPAPDDHTADDDTSGETRMNDGASGPDGEAADEATNDDRDEPASNEASGCSVGPAIGASTSRALFGAWSLLMALGFRRRRALAHAVEDALRGAEASGLKRAEVDGVARMMFEVARDATR